MKKQWLLQFAKCKLFICLFIGQAAFAQSNYQFTDTLMYQRLNAGIPVWDSARFYVYIPSVPFVRGILLAPHTLQEGTFLRNYKTRIVTDSAGLGIVYISRSPFSVFDTTKGHDVILNRILAKAALISNHPEIVNAPWFTIGHSTGGIFAYNVPFWKPEKSFGAIVYKSGKISPPTWLGPNPNLEAMSHVPLMALNGQFEEYGPGPNGVIPPGTSHEVQWWSVRDSVMKWRGQNPPFLMTQYVESGGTHSTWSQRNFDEMALFIAKCVQYRLPRNANPLLGAVSLNIIPDSTGTLSDTVIDALFNSPVIASHPLIALWGNYPIAKRPVSYWHFDNEIALSWANFHYGFGYLTGMKPKRQQNLPKITVLLDGFISISTDDLIKEVQIFDPLGQTLPVLSSDGPVWLSQNPVPEGKLLLLRLYTDKGSYSFKVIR